MSKTGLETYQAASKNFDHVSILHNQGTLFEKCVSYEDFLVVAQTANEKLEQSTWLKALPFKAVMEEVGEEAFNQLASDVGVSLARANIYDQVCRVFEKLTPSAMLSFGHHEPLAKYYEQGKIDAVQVDKLITRAETEGRPPVENFTKWVKEEAKTITLDDDDDLSKTKGKVNHHFQFRVKGTEEDWDNYQASILEDFKAWFKDFRATEALTELQAQDDD